MKGLRGQSALVVGVPLLITLFGIFGTSELQREANHAERLSDYSDARQYTSEQVMLRLVDAETGVRGYAATGDRRFLEPYNGAVRTLPGLLSTLRDPGLKVPAKIRAASIPIANAARDEMTLLAQVESELEASRRVPPDQLLRGKSDMDSIRKKIDVLQSIERVVNTDRRQRAARDQRNLSAAIDALFVFAVCGGIGAMLVFSNRVVRRLRTVIENTERVADGRELNVPLRGPDEIAAVDRAVHTMTVALRKHDVDILRANQALDMRNLELSGAYRELERFSYSVSHDLRAPVRTIGSFSNRLEIGYSGVLDAEGLRLLGIVKSEAGRLGRLIDELLEFSRVGRQALKAAPVDMTELAREVSDLARAGIDRDVTITIGNMPAASGDRVLLRQVWENLISNALKYSSSQAQSVVGVSGTADGSSLVYRVTDNGVGFDMKYAHKLFNVFERLHRADEFDGVGVGLAIVKRIVERHGGAVSVAAELGAGATFTFSLPAHGAS
jgi:signal transduction histidine kinase